MTFSDLFTNRFVPLNFNKGDKCAVVGNSGSLLGSEYGDFIDSHDFVLRMNAAEIDGYEEDVGSKCTMRIINGTLLKGYSVEQTDTPENWIRTLTNENIVLARTREWAYANAVKEMVNKNKLYFPSDMVNDVVGNYESRFRLRLASTGLYCLIVFSEFFNEVNGFGFGFHQDDLERRHYWESYDEEHEVNHEWDKEKRAVERLQNRNRFEVY